MKKLFNNSIINYLLFFLAVLYGGFLYNFPQESVTFAKTFLNQYNYNFTNEWFHSVLDSPITAQIYIPYLLLNIGIGDNFLNFFLGSITCLLSFYSIFILSSCFTENKNLSFIVVIIFLFHRFIDTHWYGIYYPVNFFYFGQMGMYFTILTSSLYLKNNSKLALFFLILNFFSHAAWGLFNIFIIITMSFLKKELPKFNIYHFLFFIFLLILMIFIHSDFTIFRDYILASFNDFQLNNDISSIEKRAYEVSHTPFFNFDKGYIFFTLNFIRFFFYETLLLFLYFFLQNKISHKFKIIFKTYIICSFVIIFYFFLNYFFQINNIFFVINENIPFLLNRMLITRFLNINNIFVLIFSISYIFYLYDKEKSKIALIYLIVYFSVFIICIISFAQIITEHMPIIKYQKAVYNSLIWINYPALIIIIFFEKKISINVKYKLKIILNFLIKIFPFVFILVLFPVKYYSFKKFTNENSLVLEKINNTEYKEIIIGPLIYGYIDPSFLTNSAVALPSFNLTDANQITDIWCKNKQDLFFYPKNYFDFIYKECFEKRTKDEWLEISKLLNINYIIVRDYISLNTNLLSENNFIKVYQINE